MTMARGQLEVSFQWIFALIAGVAFLVVFFFAFKACSDTGETRVSGSGARAAANALSATAWQVTNKTTVLPDLDVMCVEGGSLTLSTPGSADIEPIRVPLDRVPAFLSPNLEGKNAIVTREVSLESSPRISLGTVLYGLNENTYYVFVRNSAGDEQEVLELLNIKVDRPNVKIVNSAAAVASLEAPKTASSVIVVSFGTTPVSGWPSGAQAAEKLNVRLTADEAIFTNDAGESTTSDVAGDHLKAGAAVAGRKATFECAKRVQVERARTLVTIWGKRAQTLATPSTTVAEECKPSLASAASLLQGNDFKGGNDDTLLKNLLTPTVPNQRLHDSQRQLFVGGCPVIA